MFKTPIYTIAKCACNVNLVDTALVLTDFGYLISILAKVCAMAKATEFYGTIYQLLLNFIKTQKRNAIHQLYETNYY